MTLNFDLVEEKVARLSLQATRSVSSVTKSQVILITK